MQRFFFDGEVISDGGFAVEGEKFNHITHSLRMKIGEKAIFCDGALYDNECELVSVDKSCAYFKIIDRYQNKTEPSLKITVFQCMPKGEKMDEAVKRCVQFGAFGIVPVLSERCVARPDRKNAEKKLERLNKISRSSAMQSMRGCIPTVEAPIDFKQAVDRMCAFENSFICYEDEKKNTLSSLPRLENEVAFLIGPEGGLAATEVEYATEKGIMSVSLGRRILRTEDAAAFLIPILLYNSGNL